MMKNIFLALTVLALAALACSFGPPASPSVPSSVPPSVPSSVPPSVPPSAASLDPRALDTAGMEECNLVSDADFSALFGQTPTDKIPEAELNNNSCYYSFSGGQTVSVIVLLGQPGRQVYDSSMQYIGSTDGAEALPLGEIAILQERDGLVIIKAVINGWYLEVNGRGFDRQALIQLARLFETRLIPYPQQSDAPAETPAASGGSQCQNPYYPVAQGASWQYRLSGVTSDTFTRTISSIRADGFDDQDVFSVGTTRRGSWACQNGNLISLTPGSGAAVTAPDVQANFTIESNSGISFPANPQPGQEWAQNIVYLGQQNVGGVLVESRNVLQTSCKAIGFEKVSVPAGAFEALRVDCTFRLDISVSGAPTFTFTSQDSAWYGQGIGMVKSNGVSNMGSTEIVLLSYNIP